MINISSFFSGKLTVPVVSDDQCLLPKTNHVSRKPSSASLMSVVNIGGEHQIRICKDCHVLLQRHDKLIEQKNHKPVIVQMYEVCILIFHSLHYNQQLKNINQQIDFFSM